MFASEATALVSNSYHITYTTAGKSGRYLCAITNGNLHWCQKPINIFCFIKIKKKKSTISEDSQKPLTTFVVFHLESSYEDTFSNNRRHF